MNKNPRWVPSVKHFFQIFEGTTLILFRKMKQMGFVQFFWTCVWLSLEETPLQIFFSLNRFFNFAFAAAVLEYDEKPAQVKVS